MTEGKFQNMILKTFIEKNVFEALLGIGEKPICRDEIDELQLFQENDLDVRCSKPGTFVKVKISEADNQDFRQILPGEVVIAALDLKDLREYSDGELEIYWPKDIVPFGSYAHEDLIKMKLEGILVKKVIEKKPTADDECSQKYDEARDADAEFSGQVD